MTRSRREFGAIRKLASGKWQSRYWDGRGERHSATHATKGDAQRHLAAAQVDLGRGAWRDPRLGRTTFASWVHTWRPTITHLRETTQQRYDALLRAHLLPFFGTKPLGAITSATVKAWRAERVAAGRDGRGAGHNTIAKAYRLLAKIMRDAVDAGYLTASPCTLRGAGQDEVREMRSATPEQIAELIAHLPEHSKAVVLVAAWCGLRFGEIAGLARRHVDLLHRTLSVERQLQHLHGKTRFVPPKTAASFRTIAMPGVVFEAIEEHLLRWTDPGADGLVFTAPEGGPLRRDNFRTRVWYPAVRAAGLQGLRFHDLRHTAGTLAATTPGTTLRDLQTRLGHASIAAAVRYQHAALERDAAIAEHLDTLARGATA